MGASRSRRETRDLVEASAHVCYEMTMFEQTTRPLVGGLFGDPCARDRCDTPAILVEPP